jgi:hypothetical protein
MLGGGGGSGSELKLLGAASAPASPPGRCGLGDGNLLADRVSHILLTILAGGTAMVSVVNYNSM